MKHLKTFEELKYHPYKPLEYDIDNEFDKLENTVENNLKIGDYVVCTPNPPSKNISNKELLELTNFINNNIGKCVFMDRFYRIQYENIPHSLLDYFNMKDFRFFSPDDIKFSSPNKEELIPYIQSNKFM